ncbi:MAG: sigma-70 family RNA polymerase sigma factor [bacterium]|nr:sigma-70 family RNA polymerase sigma factor [bacterium]
MCELTPEQQLLERITCCQRMLYGYILTLVAVASEAEDILQEANMVLLRKADVWAKTDNPEAWARKVAYNQVRAHFLRRKRDRLAFVEEDVLAGIAERLEFRLQRGRDQYINAMNGCIGKLPDHSRNMISLRYFQGHSADTIAALMSRSGQAVRVALFRIRQALLNCIKKSLAGEQA